MPNKKGCVGSYTVSGYTRSDGTEVSGYTRSCGAAHASQEDKMQRRADILYLSMKQSKNEEFTGGAAQIEDKNTRQNHSWDMPCKGRISSDYGPRKAPVAGASSEHKGIDIAVPIGTPVGSIADGKVIAEGSARGYGKWVKIDHGEINGVNVTSEYGHISESCVKYGQKVKNGDVIAKSGNEGIGSGAHLHLTIRENGKPVSPWKYIKR